eukprot:1109015-Pyramimonas_sp.AAC.1
MVHLGQLLADVLRADEDVLKVHPVALHLQHDLDHLADQTQVLLPVVNLLLKHHVVLGRLHGRQRHDVVLQRRKHVLRRPEAWTVRGLKWTRSKHVLRRPEAWAVRGSKWT